MGRAGNGVTGLAATTWTRAETSIAPEHRVSESEHRLRELADAIDALVFVCSTEGTCSFVNTALVDFTGKTVERYVGRPWSDEVHEDDRARLEERWSDAATLTTAFAEKVRMSGPDGRWHWVELKVRPTFDRRGAFAQWVGTMVPCEAPPEPEAVTSVRERKEIIPLQIAENLRDVLWVLDCARARLLYINAAYERVWGRPRSALYDDRLDWLSGVHPDDRDRVAAALPKQDDGTFDEEYRVVHPDGTTRWVRSKAAPVRDADGHLTHVLGVVEDVTERRELECQLRATQRMESIGQLAGGIAHDFNNLLTIIVACNEELLEELRDNDGVREPLLETRLAVQRATSLTRDLLAFSRRRHHEPKVTDLNEVVGEAERMLRRLLGEDVSFAICLGRRLSCVRLDPAQFTSVLVNLAVNARHAMPKGGTLSVRTFELAQGAAPPPLDRRVTAHLRVMLPDARYAVLEVADTGLGFGPEVAERIFEPFFTTKSVGKGTGLGLAVVHGIVKQSGGHIEVASAPGVGTTFRIYLPVVPRPAASGTDAALPDLRGTETVLLVEDESAVRRAAMRGLESRGFTVLPAGDAEEALAILESRKGTIDILVTDVVLPKMDGRSLVEQVATRFPAVRVLYTSGYANDDVSRYGLSLADVPFLEKPYTPHRLVRKMRQILDAGDDE